MSSMGGRIWGSTVSKGKQPTESQMRIWNVWKVCNTPSLFIDSFSRVCILRQLHCTCHFYFTEILRHMSWGKPVDLTVRKIRDRAIKYTSEIRTKDQEEAKRAKEEKDAKAKRAKEEEKGGKAKRTKEEERDAKSRLTKAEEKDARTKRTKEEERDVRTKRTKEEERDARTKRTKEEEREAKAKGAKQEEE